MSGFVSSHVDVQLFQHHLLKRLLCSCVKGHVFMGVHFWALCSVPLICLSVLPPRSMVLIPVASQQVVKSVLPLCSPPSQSVGCSELVLNFHFSAHRSYLFTHQDNFLVIICIFFHFLEHLNIALKSLSDMFHTYAILRWFPLTAFFPTSLGV